ncbi:MAG TPA: antitoxin VbhA family protein [Alphaproteobacteria bacterium]|nr:antitoxin VbhA family protein [Alphaproteobacteria bacterium]
MTDIEIQRNQRAVEHAVAQQRLEGLVVPPEAARDLQRMARGEMTAADALRAAHARFAHDEVRQ